MDPHRPAAPSTEWPPAHWAVAYFAAYFASLWLSLEGELAHWLTLVLLPTAGLWWWDRRGHPALRFRDVARRLGLHWPEGGHGLGWALILAILVQGVQLMNRAQLRETETILFSGAALWIVPAAFLIALLTAGFTEELFFRGVLQRALASRSRSQAVGVAGASLAFSLYHLPYAYLNPSWPSAGDMGHALGLAFLNGLLGGVVLGVLFVRSRSSLVPCILVHAAVDWIPVLRFLGGSSTGG